MVAASRVLNRRENGAWAGLLVAIYLVGFVVVALTQWHRLATSPDRVVAIVAAAVLVVVWVALALLLLSAVVRQLRGLAPAVAGGGVVWLASLIVAVVTFSGPSPASHDHRVAPVPVTRATIETPARTPSPLATSSATDAAPRRRDAAPSPAHHVAPWDFSSLGALPLALVAKRRRDYLAQSRLEIPDDDVDDTIEILRHLDERQLRILTSAIGDRPSGLVSVAGDDGDDAEAAASFGPVVAVVAAVTSDATLVAFARVGHSLPLGRDGAELVDRFGVVLGAAGRCVVATSPPDAMRSLALRTSFDDVVVYLGPASDLDDEIAARCVAITDGPRRRGATLEWDGRNWNFAAPAPAPPAVTETVGHVAVRGPRAAATVRVELLRAEATVIGLAEPFAAPLRRRCVEMTAYLAVHHKEPVTGDRIRSRVLGSTGDASLRTLSNTASAVRRSLGADETGPRLHPVTPAGLYQLHDVDCDLVLFHQLVAAARDPQAVAVAATLRRALELVQGEPLATALRGFEWFLAEGHLARLQRDGEWAALQLAAEARQHDDFDLAFWAIEQGRLLDPYSEALEAALHRVPRLREFGGDRPGAAQHESVGAR